MPPGKENMELKHLLSYATVVRLGSFSRAAEELFIAQPTISLHVRQLEEELQTKLLVRTTKSVEVTEKGREIYEYAASILQLRDRIMEQADTDLSLILTQTRNMTRAVSAEYTVRALHRQYVSPVPAQPSQATPLTRKDLCLCRYARE